MVVAGDRLIHIVQATVTLYRDNAFGVKIQAKDFISAMHRHRLGDVTMTHSRRVDGLKETVIKVIADDGVALCHAP